MAALGASWMVVANRRSDQRTVRQLEATGCRFDRSADSDRGQGRNHVASPTYRVDPPAGGNHLAAAAAAGEYEDRLPDDGQLVHSLEHGDVILWHRPDAGEATLATLRRIADRYADDVLIVARSGLASEAAATAWHRRLHCPAVEEQALAQFVGSFRDKGPEREPDS